MQRIVRLDEPVNPLPDMLLPALPDTGPVRMDSPVPLGSGPWGGFSPGVPPPDPQVLSAHPADAEFALVDGSTVTARLSLWRRLEARLNGRSIGAIGRFAAATGQDAHLLLDHACAVLANEGCEIAVGPLDGDTVHAYRFVTERGEEPAFIMEPDNPPEWPQYWREAGFTVLASYFSSVNEDLAYEDPRLPAISSRLDQVGIEIRAMRPDSFMEELSKIYEISEVSFRGNFLASPIAREQFLALYAPYESKIDPDLVAIAEQAGRPVGFVFALPDLLQAMRGQAVDTVILKTIAVLPGRDYAGLGTVLGARINRFARERSYRRVIYALMHESNNSLNMSARYGRRIRRYELFSKELDR